MNPSVELTVCILTIWVTNYQVPPVADEKSKNGILQKMNAGGTASYRRRMLVEITQTPVQSKYCNKTTHPVMIF